MAKQSTHSELQWLFEVARRDIPSAAEQQDLRASVLGALRSGATAQSALPDLALDRAPRAHSLALKLIVSLGTAGLLTLAAAGLYRHWPHTAPPVASSVTPVPSATNVAPPALDEPPGSTRLQKAPGNQSEPPQPLPADPATTSRSNAPATTALRAVTAKPPVSEAEIIEQARQQLQNNPAQALALTKTHRRLYPKGVLAQEREVIAIEALARLGKSKAAEKRAEAFRAAQPNSIHDLHLRSTLGDAGVRPSP